MKRPPPHPEPEESLPSTEFTELLECCGLGPRLEILLCLTSGPLSVGEIVSILSLAQPHVSNHLRLLRGVGLVVSVPDKKLRVYHLTERAKIVQIRDTATFQFESTDKGSIIYSVSTQSRFWRDLPLALRARLEQGALRPVITASLHKDKAMSRKLLPPQSDQMPSA